MTDHTAPLTTTIHWITHRRPTEVDALNRLVQILTPNGVIDCCSVTAANGDCQRSFPWAHCPGWNRRDSELEALRRELLLVSDQVAILQEKLEGMQ